MMTSKLINIIKKHYKIILLVLVMGILSSVPYYISSHHITNFQGIYNQVGDDVNYYRTRARDVMDGHVFVSNPYIAEHKSDLSIQPWLPDLILGKSIQWLGLSIPGGFILWNFILTPMLLMLSYAILFNLTESKRWSLLGSIFFFLYVFPTNFLRLPSPGFNFVFFLATLLFLILYIKKDKIVYSVSASLFFGSLFYIYPWYWTYYIIFFLIFIVLGFGFCKDFEWKKYGVVFLSACIIGIPYFLTVLKSSKLVGYSETIIRQGAIHSHFPSGIAIVFLALVALVVFAFAYRKRVIEINKLSVFIFSGVVACIVSVNQHIITGINLEFSSHYLISSVFLSFLALFYVVGKWLRQQPEQVQKILLLVVTICITISSFLGVVKLIKAETNHSEIETYMQNYAPVFTWFNENALPDQVVYANDEIESLVPVYTSQNVYFSYYAFLSISTDEEIEKRFIINRYFDVFDPEYITANARPLFGTFYINEYYHNASKNKLRKLFAIEQTEYTMYPLIEIQRVINKAQMIKKAGFEKALKTYRVDYTVWDTNRNPDWILNRFSFLKQVYSHAGIIIYKVN